MTRNDLFFAAALFATVIAISVIAQNPQIGSLAEWAQVIGVAAAIFGSVSLANREYQRQRGDESRRAWALESGRMMTVSTLVVNVENFLTDLQEWFVKVDKGELEKTDVTIETGHTLLELLERVDAVSMREFAMMEATARLRAKMVRIMALIDAEPAMRGCVDYIDRQAAMRLAEQGVLDCKAFQEALGRFLDRGMWRPEGPC